MKINEKSLVAFAVSNESVDKEGWLLKRADLNRNYQKRWFVLKGNLLFYFEKRGDKEPLGVIILEGCTVELLDDEQYNFKVEFHGPNNRAYYLGAESQETMEQWMKAIACAGYDYMKLLVAELRQQLQELENKTLLLVPIEDSPVPPPRNRQNPFNKSESSISRPSSTDFNRSNSVSNTNNVKNKGNFREIHTSIGRPILLDLNAWKYSQQKSEQQNSNKFDDLIVL